MATASCCAASTSPIASSRSKPRAGPGTPSSGSTTPGDCTPSWRTAAPMSSTVRSCRTPIACSSSRCATATAMSSGSGSRSRCSAAVMMLPQSPAHPPLVARMFRSLLLLLAVLTAPLAAQPSTEGRDTEPVDQTVIPTAPVVVDGVPLFHVRGISSYPASYRASVIADRIRAVARDPEVELDDIQLREADRETRIAAGDQQIMSVFD